LQSAPACAKIDERMKSDSSITEPNATHAAEPSKGASETRTQAPGGVPAGPAGQRFGRYEALEFIGGGGMGIVWRARDHETGQIVALKTLCNGADIPATLADRFLVEASAVARLSHPNIVPIFHFDRHHGQPYFTMPYLPAGSLARHRERFHTRRAAVALIEKVACAIHHAHVNGVLHRDLKPANILLDDADEPMVADFGLAKLADATQELTHTRMPLGTAPYMSPEQAAFQHEAIGPASDVWGLGVTLYELLLNRRPFNGSSTAELTPQILRDDPPRPIALEADFDRELESIVLKCLQKMPAQRYQTASDLADDLHNWLAGTGVNARYDPRQTPAAVRRRRRRQFLRSSAIVALSAVLGGASWWFVDREQSRSRDRVLAEELQWPLNYSNKPVELLKKNGEPRWKEWPLGTCRTKAEDGALSLTTKPPRLLELMRSTTPFYRLRADVRLNNGTGYAGIYVGRSACSGRDTLYQCCILLSVGAVPGAEQPKPDCAFDAIFAANGASALPKKISFKSGMSAATLSNGEWASLSIEVGNNRFIAKLEPDEVALIERSELDRRMSEITTLIDPSLTGVLPAFGPFQGLGLYAHEGTVSFRNVVVEKLN
jgi:serine/threonine protein kinase